MAAKGKKEVKEAKADKKSAKLAAKAPEAPEVTEPAVDLEELEEQQAEAATTSQNSSAAALAAASGPTEMSASFKNFRHHPDMENFYRFIFDNDLRHEALEIIDQIMIEKAKRKLVKQAKNHAH
ncbi:MAG: hypothetical protein A2X94_03135 [Bdellovibrionales bacterium GWB1_55_8]|nr:MAG: hypothetical protein A2X94_03135 [Bdellovibrionales bacterium GWB1_55_8]